MTLWTGSPVHGILQARILEWVAIPCSRRSSQPESPALQTDSLLSEPPGKSKNTGVDSLFLPEGNFQTQELNQGLLHCGQILYQLSYREAHPCLLGGIKDFPGGSDGKASAYSAGDPGSIPGSGRSPGEGNGNPLQYSLEKAMAPHSSTLAWKIPWIEEPGRLQSMGSQSQT